MHTPAKQIYWLATQKMATSRTITMEPRVYHFLPRTGKVQQKHDQFQLPICKSKMEKDGLKAYHHVAKSLMASLTIDSNIGKNGQSNQLSSLV